MKVYHNNILFIYLFVTSSILGFSKIEDKWSDEEPVVLLSEDHRDADDQGQS